MAELYGLFPGPGAPQGPRGRPPSPQRPHEPPHRVTQDSEWTCIVCLTDQRPNPQMAFCSPTVGHGVCAPCLRQYAEVEVGQRHASLVCPQTGCSEEYNLDDAPLQQWLGRELVERFTRLAVAKELAEAGLGDMIEYCPQCGAGGIIEDDENEFFCPNPECGAVICRRCRREAHGSVPCRAGGDEHTANRIRVEEAMSEALIRSCPRCRTACIKEEGCNKMTCTTCQINFCYNCREEIDAGYDHFEQPPNHCHLYDEVHVDERHNAEVRAAEREARARYLGRDQADHPEQADADAEPEAGPSWFARRHAQEAQALVRPLPITSPLYLYRPAAPVAYVYDPVRVFIAEARIAMLAPPAVPAARVPGYENFWRDFNASMRPDAFEVYEPMPPDFMIPTPPPPPNFTVAEWLLWHYHWVAGLPPPPPNMPMPALCEVGCQCNKTYYCYATYRLFGWPRRPGE